MIIMVIILNWLTLLAVSEKLSRNFFNIKGDSVWCLILADDNNNIRGEETTMYLGFMGGTLVVYNLGVLKHFGHKKSYKKN